MKQITPRERIMVMALPASIILLAYVFFVARPGGEDMEALRRQVAVAQAQVPSAQDQARVMADLRRLEAEANEKRAEAREREERSAAVRAFWNDPDAKARGGTFIGNLLAENGVILIEEAVASEDDRSNFSSLLQPLPAAELWRLRLAGSYDAMRQTVAAIGETQLPIVPAGIEMESKVEGNQTIHLWNLWICR
ncbi:MAG: hypothetical protein AAGC68_02210 [Verrucomicrobiota bacterium]